MGDSGKLRFYELDHESKMRILKTHSHTSNGLVVKPETREEKAVERSADPTTRQKSPINNLPRAAGVAGGGREGSTANQSQKRYYCEIKGGGHRVPPAGLPIVQVLGEYSLSFLRRDVALFVSTRARDSF